MGRDRRLAALRLALLLTGRLDTFADALRHLALPALALELAIVWPT